MRRLILPLFGLVILVGLASNAAASDPKHLTDARVLLNGLKAKDTSYTHDKIQVRWKGVDGAKKFECHADCSGFMDALLKHSYGYNEPDLRRWFGSTRPKARDYFEQIKNHRGFRNTHSVRNAEPGDFLAVKYPPGSENTGHVMLVNSKPKLMQPVKPLVEGTQQWEVEVIDCSTSGHGPTDTRHVINGKDRTGLGRGILRIYTRHQAVAGYSWSTSTGSKFYAQEERPLVIGHLKSGYRP